MNRCDVQMKDPRFNNILKRLRSLSDPKAIAGMARYGINPERALGISMLNLRGIAKEVGKDSTLADMLWASGIHEARILASLVHDPRTLTEKKMELWVKDFDSWDVCDQCCSNLFGMTGHAYRKAVEWSSRKEEFVKRAGFVLMARLALSDKNATDGEFERFFPIIERESVDGRNYVKKAVNWALRQIGKRNLSLNKKAIRVTGTIGAIDSPASKWVAADALRELRSEAVQTRLLRKNKKSSKLR